MFRRQFVSSKARSPRKTAGGFGHTQSVEPRVNRTGGGWIRNGESATAFTACHAPIGSISLNGHGQADAA